MWPKTFKHLYSFLGPHINGLVAASLRGREHPHGAFYGFPASSTAGNNFRARESHKAAMSSVSLITHEAASIPAAPSTDSTESVEFACGLGAAPSPNGEGGGAARARAKAARVRGEEASAARPGQGRTGSETAIIYYIYIYIYILDI